MNTVPSTPTFSSRNLEAKQLADGNALKIQQKEVLEREIRELTAAKDSLILKIGHTPAEFDRVEKEHSTRMRGVEDATVKARIELQDVEERLKDARVLLVVLEPKVKLLETQEASLKADVGVWIGRKDSVISSTKEAERKYEQLIKEKSGELSELSKKATAATEANIIFTSDMDRRMASVVEQERLISIRRNDLEIYEARLRKKYPNDPIIL